MRSVGPGDDRARFLADLRALRDTAAIGYEELAARAHYPSDALKEAENGSSLPSLPVLAAYVRACDGNVLEWEDRWRRLGDGTRADPNLPVRPAGASAAAVAGARAGIGVAPPEAYDTERVRAALRGDHGRSAGITGQRGTPVSGAAAVGVGPADRGATGWDAGAGRETGKGWDAGASMAWDSSATQDSTHLETGGGWFTAANPDAGGGWDAGAGRETEGSWGAGTGTESKGSWETPAARGAGSSWDTPAGTDAGSSWSVGAATDGGSIWDTGASRDGRGSWDAGTSREAGSIWSAGAGVGMGAGTGREAGSGWDSAASGETAAAELSGSAGWETAAGQGVGLPNGSHHAEHSPRGPFDATVTDASDAIGRQPEDARFSWLEPTLRTRGSERPAAESASEPTGHAGSARASADVSAAGGVAATGQPRASAQRAASAATLTAAHQPGSRRRDRPGIWRMLAVIVLAALLGSVLMLLLR